MHPCLLSPSGARAAEMFRDGARDAEVVLATGLAPSTVRTYRCAWRSGMRPRETEPVAFMPRGEASIRRDLLALLTTAFKNLPPEFRR